MRENIEADEIESTECCRLRAPDSWAGNLVDFLDGVSVVEHRLDRVKRAEGSDAIGNKIGPVFRCDYTFAQSLIEKAKQKAGDFRLRPLGAYYFDEMQVARWIKKMNANKVRAKICPSGPQREDESECHWYLKRRSSQAFDVRQHARKASV